MIVVRKGEGPVLIDRDVVEQCIDQLLDVAASMWVDLHGHENYTAGASSMTGVGMTAAAERAWSAAHEATYPERWAR